MKGKTRRERKQLDQCGSLAIGESKVSRKERMAETESATRGAFGGFNAMPDAIVYFTTLVAEYACNFHISFSLLISFSPFPSFLCHGGRRRRWDEGGKESCSG